MNEKKVVVVTGASSGFGNLTARALAAAGHTAYAGMRATGERNAPAVRELAALSAAEGIDARSIEMDVQDQTSIDTAIAQIIGEQGRIDVLVHNAGHMVLGPADEVSDEIVRIVGLPAGERPFRVTIDPTRDGSEVVSTVYDRIRHDFFHRIGIQELLTPGASV